MSDKTLYRSRTDRMAGGVCAGIAEYFGLDPTVVRLLVVLVTLLTSGGTLIVYIVLWAVVPEEPGVLAEEGALMSEDTPAPTTSGQTSPPSAPYEPAQPVEHTPTPAVVAPPLHSHPPKPPAPRGHGSVWIGLALVFIGGVLLVQMFVPQVRLWEFWPVILIVWGLVVIFRPRRW